jgi:hypothetical protein
MERTLTPVLLKGQWRTKLSLLRRFRASFRPFVAFGSSALLISIALFTADPNFGYRAAVAVPIFTVSMALRFRLHTMQDQQRARLLYGRGVVVLNLLRTVCVAALADGATTRVTAATFLVVRLLGHNTQLPFLAYSAVDITHCLVIAIIHAVGATICPPLSEIGRPLEPIIIWSSVLVAFSVCLAIDEGQRNRLKEGEKLKRERSEAQARADAATEALRTGEAESISFRLATAEANRVADSQLNHMIKGLCGAAKSYCLLIEARTSDPQCTKWARYSTRALGSAIMWAQSRQVLVSLADRTFQSVRTNCDVETFLREMLSDDDVVQVHGLTIPTALQP